MICADKPVGVCSGRGCNNPSVGSLQELHAVPSWRKPVEYSDRILAFELGVKVNYCADHERSARDYAK